MTQFLMGSVIVLAVGAYAWLLYLLVAPFLRAQEARRRELVAWKKDLARRRAEFEERRAAFEARQAARDAKVKL